MKTLYLDLFSGIAGDMFIGALLDLGVDPSLLETELKKLNLDGYHLHASRQQRAAISGVKFDVHLAHIHANAPAHAQRAHEHPHEHPHERPDEHSHDHSRNFTEIKGLISQSKLSAWVKRKSIGVFARIAEAEGKIHGLPPDEVHFHEVGAVDSIVDIVGAAIALELLGKPRVLSSPVVEGTGWIHCAHGRFPIPIIEEGNEVLSLLSQELERRSKGLSSINTVRQRRQMLMQEKGRTGSTSSMGCFGVKGRRRRLMKREKLRKVRLGVEEFCFDLGPIQSRSPLEIRQMAMRSRTHCFR
jgi:hypothetical protein